MEIIAYRETEAFFDRLGIESARLRYAQEVVPFNEIAFQLFVVSRHCFSEYLKAGTIRNLAGRSLGSSNR
ncbi:MAG: hypothetical protein ACKPKO_20690, partial [Candidatus Fonsibacter sp.]